MAKYRKKPVVVDAVQWFKHGDRDDVRRNDLWGDRRCDICEMKMKDHGIFTNHDGAMTVICPGDWIITRPGGLFEHYKRDIFEATYEIADDVTRAIYNVLDGKPLS